MLSRLVTPEKELQILWAQSVHSGVVRVDRRVNHVCLLLLKQYHAALYRILDTETSDTTGASLADAMASIRRLPFSVTHHRLVLARVRYPNTEGDC